MLVSLTFMSSYTGAAEKQVPMLAVIGVPLGILHAPSEKEVRVPVLPVQTMILDVPSL